ncbi:MAG: hypothetical protein ACTSRZ_13945 [Promethearchaeota archaeon]
MITLAAIIKLADNCPYRELARELSLILRPNLIFTSILARYPAE